uniref:Leucine rich repeat containing 49 n=1 Tax=Propithecus coquereli TaxID=379532 RepID=A0A2K6FNC1_PROCO
MSICISFLIGDHINLVSSSMPSFPILQRSSEEKILYSDRLTLESSTVQEASVLPSLVQIKKISNLENLKNIYNIFFLSTDKFLLSRDVDNLPCLQRLFLSFNNISSFDNVSCLSDSTSLSDITFDGNPIAQESWYKHTVLQNMMQLRQLDMKRITVRTFPKCLPREEENKEKKHTNIFFEGKLTINNVARKWDLQQRVANIATTQDRKDSDSPSQDPCQIDGSTISASPEETGSLDSGLTSALQGLSVIDSHLVEVDGDTLALYGSGALESLDRNWSAQTAGMVTTVSFTFIEFDEIVQVLPKLKIKFPNSLVNIIFNLDISLAHVASSELPQYRLISILGDARKKQFRYLLETKGKKPGIVNEENNDSKRLVGENTNRATLNYTTRDFYNEKLEEIKEKKKFCKMYIEDLVKEATEINMKNEALQKLWPQMFIELVRDAVIEIRNKNSYMKLCLQQITDQK